VLFYFCVCASFLFCVNLRIANDFFRPWPAFIGFLSINSIQFNGYLQVKAVGVLPHASVEHRYFWQVMQQDIDY